MYQTTLHSLLVHFIPFCHIITVLAPWKFSLPALLSISLSFIQCIIRVPFNNPSSGLKEVWVGHSQPRLRWKQWLSQWDALLEPVRPDPWWPVQPVSLCLEGSRSQSPFEDVQITDEGGRASNWLAFAGVDVSPPQTLLSSFTLVSERRNFLSLFEWWWVAGRDGRRRINTGWDAGRFLPCVWRWEKVVWISLALAGCL